MNLDEMFQDGEDEYGTYWKWSWDPSLDPLVKKIKSRRSKGILLEKALKYMRVNKN